MEVKENSVIIKKIQKNQKKFLSFENKIKKTKSLSKRCTLASEAATFAVSHPTDIFSSWVLEEPFLELAQKHPVPLSKTFEKGTVLHVMTEAYLAGGHTRCVERWIAQCPEQKHSCILLNQKGTIPKVLIENVKKSGGNLWVYEAKDPILKKALQLRQEASHFEYIVLHVHMNDQTALIAFGTQDFKRPILFFNHADHIFWLGVSIADYVADLNSYGIEITKSRRGIQSSSILGIPSEETQILYMDKKKAREKFHIPFNQKVIFASGNAKKFAPCGDCITYQNIIQDVLREHQDILFIIAGINKKHYFWPKLERLYPKNLLLFKSLEYQTEYLPLLAVSDLVLDSTPCAGATTLIDAVRAGKPALTLNKLQSDFILKSLAYCEDYSLFLDKINQLLTDEREAKKVYQSLYQSWQEQSNPNKWKERCQRILTQLPKQHQIHPFNRKEGEVSLCSIQNFSWISSASSGKQKIRELRKKLFQIRFNKQEKIIRIFGIPLLEKNENWK